MSISLLQVFTDKTIIAEPLLGEMPSNGKLSILQKRKFILKKMKTYINEEFNPAQCHFYDSLEEDIQKPKSVHKILHHLEISNNEYE